MSEPLIPLPQDKAWDDLPMPSFLIATGTREERRAAWDRDMAALKATGWGKPTTAEQSADLRAQADAAARERHRVKSANKREHARGADADKEALAAGKTWDAVNGGWI